VDIRPIGIIRTPFSQAAGMPVQPRGARGAEGTVEVLPEYADALADVDGFERLWLLYEFHRAGPVRLRVRPFMDGAERGLFATRAPCRPNAIGMSSVRLVRREGLVLHVADVDMLDGTPLVDIKPYVPDFDCFEVTRVGWLAGKRAADAQADDRFATPPDEE
jgi:tRNA-Thr(GGU) m(6)t(6)A37 methyltransferase TsaA